MQRIEFSEMTNRLRRNLMGAAFLIIGIAGFDIKVGKVSASGMELENLTTEVVLMLLLAFLIYHAFAFTIRAFEEYRHWELRLADKETSVYSGGVAILELADQMKGVGETLEKVTANSGAIGHRNQDILTEADARQLKETSKAALIYGKRFKNFPTITRLRFWAWDIATAGAVTVIATLFAISALPAGLISRCLL